MQTCPYCGGTASFATVEDTPRIFGHPCPRLEGIWVYWYPGSLMVFITQEHAKQTYRRGNPETKPPRLAEVYEFGGPRAAGWPEMKEAAHGLD